MLNFKKYVKTVLALLLVVAMISSLGASAALPGGNDFTSYQDGNIALIAAPSAEFTNGYITSGGAQTINDGKKTADDDNGTGSWNSYGYGGTIPFPTVWVELEWDNSVVIDASRVMWWHDGGGVSLPKSAVIQYWDEEAEAFAEVSNMRDSINTPLTSVGIYADGTSGQNTVWNGVTFDEVTTTRLRLVITQERESADSASGGAGINEWEVFGSETEPTLQSISISGESTVAIGVESTYTAATISKDIKGAEYKWALGDDGYAEIIGDATGDSVTVKGLREGIATLSVTAKHGSNPEEVVDTFDIMIRDTNAVENIAVRGLVKVPYSNGGVSANINDGTVSTSSNYATTWNTWGTSFGNANNPFYVTLEWVEPYEVQSTRVLWWIYTDSGVDWPRSCRIEYMDKDGEWIDLGPIGTDHTGEIGQTWIYNGIWNDIVFEEPVVTTSLRLVVLANRNSGTAPGFGINEWEVYGKETDPELRSVSISGKSSLPEGVQNEYEAIVTSPRIEGATYEWELSNGNAKIVGGTNDSKVVLEGVMPGETTLNVIIRHDSGVLETSDSFDITVREVKPQTHKTSTAAGREPILPERVIMEGIEFDDATPSYVGSTGYDFGEEFTDSLIEVEYWDEVPEALYAEDQIGKTFTVSGNVKYKDKDFPVQAEITVSKAQDSLDYNHSVTSENVSFSEGSFWYEKQLTNATSTLDAGITQIESTSSSRYALQNFINANTKLTGGSGPTSFNGYVFQDTDVYKTLEAISYNLAAIEDDESMTGRKEELQATLDSWIEKITAVQYADGYIGTHFTLRANSTSGGGGTGTHRWRHMANHEMYNIGHFLEAVVAYTRYTVGVGRPDYRLYEAGKRAADCIVNTFGPGGFRTEVPGHEEIELGLMKFAALVEEYEGEGTGQDYRDTIELLVDRRGRKTGENARESGYNGGTYSQDATPLVNETKAVGHAVRAMYFYTGATDVAIAMPDANPNKTAFLTGITNIYDSVSERNSYITGGLGSGESSEGFGDDYHIRNADAYTETCAAIAGANWYQRLNLYYEDAKYVDSYERALYNGVLVGVNHTGNLFYYGCGLDTGTANRSSWFGCACCPPNVMRTIANIGGYMYTVKRDVVFVNLYGGSIGNVKVEGDNVEIIQETNYPWNGAIRFAVTPDTDKEFTLNLRIPGWVSAQKNRKVTIKVAGVEIDAKPSEKGYVSITRNWSAEGTVIEMDIPMEIRRTEADENVSPAYPASRYVDYGQNNKVVIERGPLVYNLETASVPDGNPETATSGKDARYVYLPRTAELTASYDEDLLGGIVTITGYAKWNAPTEGYNSYNPGDGAADQYIQLIPYYSRGNRGNNPQNDGSAGTTGSSSSRVWLYATEKTVQIQGGENHLKIGETTELTATPHVNANDRDDLVTYEWSVDSGAVEITNTQTGLTDDSGPNKVGGIGYQRKTSVATVKAVGGGTATLTVAMKDEEGNVIDTDSYTISTNISADSRLRIEVKSLPRHDSENYDPSFTLTSNKDMGVSLYVSAYNANGTLVNIRSVSVDLKAGVETDVQASIPREEGYTYRFFLWDDTFMPLTDITSIGG